MTGPNRPTKNRKRAGRGKGPKVDPAEFWNPVPPLPDPEPIAVATDPTIVFRSLGDLPVHDHGGRTSHEIHRVLVRSSTLAGALAELAGLLEDPDGPATP
jgi:hypothetical protein